MVPSRNLTMIGFPQGTFWCPQGMLHCKHSFKEPYDAPRESYNHRIPTGNSFVAFKESYIIKIPSRNHMMPSRNLTIRSFLQGIVLVPSRNLTVKDSF